MIWNFTRDCIESAVYGCIDALKYIEKSRNSSLSLSEILVKYMDDVGIVDKDGSVLNGLIAGITAFGFLSIPNGVNSKNSHSWMITSLGKRLIDATTTFEIQQCYLDAMKKTQYISDNGSAFSPLQWTIDVIHEIKRRGEDTSLKCSEFAYFVQTTSPYYGIQETVNDILKYRMTGQKNICYGYDKETLLNFSDLNIRCLRATGMFRKKGRGFEMIDNRL